MLSSQRKRKFEATVADDELLKNIAKSSKEDSASGYNETMFDETEYYFENGLRKVYPYFFTFSTFCKGRWVGKRLLDVFAAEFRAFNKEQYEKSILNGNLKVNNLSVSLDYILKDNDRITNKVHRHEVAVAACPIKIIHCSDDLVVIDKPCSIPVHPCGRYRHNSLLFILAKEHNLKQLHTIHRLDRLTSGILFFTKSLKRSQDIDDQIRSRKVEKEYICRVEGEFPDEILSCCQPIEILSPKIGVCITSPQGKECETEFEKINYNGKSSLVTCRPKGGRMHQIRVHLQYLGYPIINDPIYNDSRAFGPTKGKNGETGKTKEKLLKDLMEIHNIEQWLKLDNEVPNPDNDTHVNKVSDPHKDSNETHVNEVSDPDKDSNDTHANQVSLKILKQTLGSDPEMAERYKKIHEKIIIDPTCELCQNQYRDPEPKDLVMFLHAFKYKIDENVEYKTELPVWARSDWNDL